MARRARSRGPRFYRRRFLLALGAAAGVLPACTARPPSRPSVVLISIDTLRADHVGAYGYPRSTTPFLDSLAATGRVFSRVIVPLPATGPSHASLLTSLHPLEHSVLTNAMALPEELETLAEVLRRSGYFTMGAVGAKYLASRYGFHQGFDVFSDEWDATLPGNTGTRRAAPSVNESVARMLQSYVRQRRRQPFFLFVHYYDVHGPYTQRPIAVREPVPPPPGPGPKGYYKRVRAYDSGVRFVDEHVKLLYERLRDLKLTDDLVLGVTSDHGEQLGEHAYAGGHVDIYRETVEVPLILHGAGWDPGRVVEPVSSMDVAVSMLGRLGLRFPGREARRSLASGRPVPLTMRWEGGGPRSFLVLGYPSYTRSIATVEERRWFIRNLDFAYRQAFVEALHEPPGTAAATGSKEAALIRSNDSEALYVVPGPPLDAVVPLYVSVDVRLGKGCAADVSIGLEPKLSVLADPIRVEGAARIHYPAASWDTSTVSIRPASCRGGVSYRFVDFEGLDKSRSASGARPMETALWRELKTGRKGRRTNELYDVVADPGMTSNRIEAPEMHDTGRRLDALIDRQWAEYRREGRRAAPPGARRTPEEIEALRSLGYIE